jgi:hypothetical protein
MFMVHDGCDLAHCVRHPELIPLTAFLCTAGYEAAARAAILQYVHAQGAAGLVEAGLIEPDDWEAVATAIRAGEATADFVPAPIPAPTLEPKPVDLSPFALTAETVADDFDRLAIDLGYTIDAEDWRIACSTMRRVIDRLGMHAASLRAVAGKARAAGGPEAASTEPALPPNSGGAPEPDAEVFVPSEAEECWLARNSRPPIWSAGDLLAAMAQFLTSVGLEPDVRGDAVGFLFLGHLHRVEVEDVEARLERCQVSDDEAAMLAAGLPVG